MRLSRLELKGFKSFRDKTVLKFPHRLMGVIGPNGSGKSNITEAICFVLGKSRGLRAANLQELIYNGAISDPPAKKAVVSLTLEEDEGRKHNIMRIVEADGTSIYKLNGKRSTRSKILEVVGDSEYNILLQDDVTKAVEMKPKDRRRVIDGLCGIGAYDEKRDKAIRELEKVQERIKDTSIILGTKAGHLTNLRSERDEALDFQKTRQNLSRTRASLIDKDLTTLLGRDEKLRAMVSQKEGEISEAAGNIREFERQISEASSQKDEIDRQILELEKERGGAQIAQMKGELLRLSDRISYLSDQIAKSESEYEKTKTMSKSLKNQFESLKKTESELEIRRKTQLKQIESQQKKASDPALEEEFQKLKESIYQTRSELGALQQLVESQKKETLSLETERKNLESRMREGLNSDSSKRLERASISLKQEKSQLAIMEREYEDLNKKIISAQKSINSGQIALERKKTELSAALRASGGLQKAVREVIGLKKVIPGIHGPVMQLGTITEESYASAINEASRGRMQNIAVSTVDDAARCIEHLRKKKVGRCTFLPLDKLNPRISAKAPEQSLGFARDYIKTSKRFKKVFEYVFGDTIVVRDINNAKAIGIGRHRMVTLDGDLMEVSGAMSGGFKSHGADINFSNVDEFEKEIASLTSSLLSLENEHEALIQELAQKEGAINSIRQRADNLQKETDSAKLDQGIESERRSSLRENLNRTVESISRIGAQIQKANVESNLLKKREASLSKKLAEIDSKRDPEAGARLDRLRQDMSAVEVEMARCCQAKESVVSRMDEADARMVELSQVIKQADSQLDDMRRQKSSMESSLAGIERDFSELDENLEKARQSRESIEESLFEASRKKAEAAGAIDSFKEKISESRIELARVGENIESLKKAFREFEGIELFDMSRKDLESQAQKLEERMKGFDTVNLKAVEAYDEVEKEINDIQEKLDTLKRERDSINDFMEKIEAKKRKTFNEAFEKVKSNFETIFRDLSDGRGTLIIDDPLNISEAGLIIKASPGGKKLMSLEQMSGGEKVLTSTAFLLAIQQYKPAFFYVVDELDAALDHRNSIRLAQMLKDSSSQFLMVTHNYNMIRYLNSAIGVTMVNGVSTVLTKSFDELSKQGS